MIDNNSLQDLQQARDQLINKLVSSDISDVDSLMPLINAVDDVTTAFDADNVATE